MRYDDATSNWILPTNAPEPGLRTIGQDSGANLALDVNEVLARNNGAAATLLLNNGQVVQASTGRTYLPIDPQDYATNQSPTGISGANLNDHGVMHLFDTTAAVRTLTLPTTRDIGTIFGATNKTSDNVVTINRGGTDQIEIPGLGQVTTFDLPGEGDHVILIYRGNGIWTPLSYYVAAQAGSKVRDRQHRPDGEQQRRRDADANLLDRWCAVGQRSDRLSRRLSGRRPRAKGPHEIGRHGRQLHRQRRGWPDLPGANSVSSPVRNGGAGFHDAMAVRAGQQPSIGCRLLPVARHQRRCRCL